MNPRGPEFEKLLDRFLDGQATPDERAAVEAAMAQDASARAAVEMQRRVDGELRRMFAAPDVASALQAGARPAARGGGATGPVRRIGPRWLWVVAAAAALVAVAAGTWWGAMVRSPRQGLLYDLYTREVATGFNPEIPCRTELEFKRFTFYALNQAMRSSADPAHAELMGWSYRKAFSPATSVLLARVDGQDIVLLMDKQASCDAPIPSPANPDKNTVHIFRKQVGTACVYEISALSKPVLIDSLEATPPPD